VKTNSFDEIRRVIASRERLYDNIPPTFQHKTEEEGGGVTGFACTIPMAGRHIFTPSAQMHNRGNGKGGGIVAVGFDLDQLGISREVLESHYCLLIAALDPECIDELAAKHIRPVFDIAAESKLKIVKNWQELPSLEVRQPDVFRNFVRVKPAVQNGEVQIGLVCSEKQAIDATLKSLAAEDPRFCTVADKYWNARGSSSNGGSFIFRIKDDPNSPTGKTLTCED